MTDRWSRPQPRDDEEPIGALEKDHVEEILERLRTHQARSTRHETVRPLGQGGMGVVLEVRDGDLRRPLALKRLHEKRSAETDPERRRHFLARFLQEAQVTGQLAHPGIPPIHELALDAEGQPFFTMPVIRGQNLDEVFAQVRSGADGWTLPRALTVLLKVCEAMAFAHAKRVVHRDLKPENVRIGRFGEVYVMDWGLARVLDRERADLVRWGPEGKLTTVHTDRDESDGDANAVLQTLDGDVIGTPFYMPPEQARGELEGIGPWSDIYALGGMLYLLLTGSAPYQPADGRISARTVLGLVLHGPPADVLTRAPAADRDLAAICAKAMARAPRDRYASMEDLASDIEAWIDRRPIRASAPSLGHALRLFAERHKAAVATAAAGLSALLAAGGLFVWQVTKERDEKELARLEAQRRGDAMAAAALEERQKALWPATPRQIPALTSWLADASDLLGRASTYRSARALAVGRQAEEVEAVMESTQRVQALKPQLEARLSAAESLQKVSIEDERAAWDRVIADVASDLRFGGVKLIPQLGIVPLWQSKESGLWEFWHVASGTRPQENSASDRDGIVLVLLPPGVLIHGVPLEQTETRAKRWQPDDQEIPSRISALFFGKHEVTQGQWERLTGGRPSRWQPGVTAGAPDCPRCPVESLSWVEAADFARKLDLRLPSEHEWEYACRGGSTFRDLVYGGDADSVQGYENIRDGLAGTVAGSPAVGWSDGFVQVAPVGSFQSNGFGLHDMLGNVSEWCSDEFLPVPAAERLAGEPPVQIRVFRGGSWYGSVLTNAGYAWYRQWDKTSSLNHARGLRVVRSPRDSE